MRPGAAAVEAIPDSVARLRAAIGGAPGTEALWPALTRLDWAAVLPNAAAPGFVYLAGACGGAAVGGGGRDLVEAAGRLAGEASEAIARACPAPAVDLPGDPAIEALWGGGKRVAAHNLTRDRAVGAPTAAIHAGSAAAPQAPPRSLGMAAGPDLAAALLAATLELVERDAAARWWSGEGRPRAVCAARAAGAAGALAAMRAGAAGGGRPTTFLALPSPTGLPVACVLSRGRDGRGLAFGFKAALALEAALEGAGRELLQMEIALEIAQMRQERGAATPHDAGVLGCAALDPDGFDAFAPLPPASEPEPDVADLGGLLERLERLGFEVTVADLGGLDGGLRVAKAFVPGLRPMPGPGPAPRPGAPALLAGLM